MTRRVLARVAAPHVRLVVTKPCEQGRNVVVGLEKPELGEEHALAALDPAATGHDLVAVRNCQRGAACSSAPASSAKFTSFVTWMTRFASFPKTRKKPRGKPSSLPGGYSMSAKAGCDGGPCS